MRAGDVNAWYDYVDQWVKFYITNKINQQNICRGFESHRLHISAFFPGKAKRIPGNVFASVRAGDVNGYDSLPLSTTVVRGEGREPRRSLLLYEVGENQLADSQTYILLVIEHYPLAHVVT